MQAAVTIEETGGTTTGIRATEIDDEPVVIEVPDDVAAALAEVPAARASSTG